MNIDVHLGGIVYRAAPVPTQPPRNGTVAPAVPTDTEEQPAKPVDAPPATEPAAPTTTVFVPITSRPEPARGGDSDGFGIPIGYAFAVGAVVVKIGWGKLAHLFGDRLASDADRANVVGRWGGKCAYRFPVMLSRCEGPIQIDHQKAHSRGGRTRKRNMQPLCRRHNTRKGATHNVVELLQHGIAGIGWVWYLLFRWLPAEGRLRVK